MKESPVFPIDHHRRSAAPYLTIIPRQFNRVTNIGLLNNRVAREPANDVRVGLVLHVEFSSVNKPGPVLFMTGISKRRWSILAIDRIVTLRCLPVEVYFLQDLMRPRPSAVLWPHDEKAGGPNQHSFSVDDCARVFEVFGGCSDTFDAATVRRNLSIQSECEKAILPHLLTRLPDCATHNQPILASERNQRWIEVIAVRESGLSEVKKTNVALCENGFGGNHSWVVLTLSGVDSFIQV